MHNYRFQRQIQVLTTQVFVLPVKNQENLLKNPLISVTLLVFSISVMGLLFDNELYPGHYLQSMSTIRNRTKLITENKLIKWKEPNILWPLAPNAFYRK